MKALLSSADFLGFTWRNHAKARTRRKRAGTSSMWGKMDWLRRPGSVGSGSRGGFGAFDSAGRQVHGEEPLADSQAPLIALMIQKVERCAVGDEHLAINLERRG